MIGTSVMKELSKHQRADSDNCWTDLSHFEYNQNEIDLSSSYQNPPGIPKDAFK